MEPSGCCCCKGREDHTLASCQCQSPTPLALRDNTSFWRSSNYLANLLPTENRSALPLQSKHANQNSNKSHRGKQRKYPTIDMAALSIQPSCPLRSSKRSLQTLTLTQFEPQTRRQLSPTNFLYRWLTCCRGIDIALKKDSRNYQSGTYTNRHLIESDRRSCKNRSQHWGKRKRWSWKGWKTDYLKTILQPHYPGFCRKAASTECTSESLSWNTTRKSIPKWYSWLH